MPRKSVRALAMAQGLFYLMAGAALAQKPSVDDRLFEQPSGALISALETKAVEATVLSASPSDRPQIPLERYEAAGGAWTTTNIVHLKLAPDLTEADVDDILDEYEFTLQSAAPDLGILTVRANLSDVFSETLTTTEWLAAAASVVQRYREDPRIGRDPDIALTEQEVSTADPTGMATLDHALVLSSLPSGEEQDWALDDIEAPKLWALLPLPRQVLALTSTATPCFAQAFSTFSTSTS